MVMDRLFLYIFTTACVCGTLSIFLYAPSLYDPREPLNTEEATDCTYWRWHGYIRLWWDSLIITNNLNNVREVWLIIFASDSFTMRWLNCTWRKKWRRVGGCPDMSGGGSADILFPLVHNPCPLLSLENLEKMTRDLLFWTWINSILLQVHVYILQMNAFTVGAIYVNKE